MIKTIAGLWSKGVDWIADKIIKVGMAVGLIDEATGRQMLIESANIGEERGERIDSSVDSFADGIVNELKKDREDLRNDLTELTDTAAEQAAAAAPEPVEVPKPAEIAATVPKALIDSQGTTGGSSAASVVSQLASDNIQKDQLSELKKINDGIDKLDTEQKPVVGA